MKLINVSVAILASATIATTQAKGSKCHNKVTNLCPFNEDGQVDRESECFQQVTKCTNLPKKGGNWRNCFMHKPIQNGYVKAGMKLCCADHEEGKNLAACRVEDYEVAVARESEGENHGPGLRSSSARPNKVKDENKKKGGKGKKGGKRGGQKKKGSKKDADKKPREREEKSEEFLEEMKLFIKNMILSSDPEIAKAGRAIKNFKEGIANGKRPKDLQQFAEIKRAFFEKHPEIKAKIDLIKHRHGYGKKQTTFEHFVELDLATDNHEGEDLVVEEEETVVEVEEESVEEETVEEEEAVEEEVAEKEAVEEAAPALPMIPDSGRPKRPGGPKKAGDRPWKAGGGKKTGKRPDGEKPWLNKDRSEKPWKKRSDEDKPWRKRKE